MPKTMLLEEALTTIPKEKPKEFLLADIMKLDSPEIEKAKKRGFGDSVKYLLGEGIIKPVARAVETIPAQAERILQAGLDNVREIAKRQLAEDGVVFGISEADYLNRTEEQKRRIALNTKIVENMDRALETSKRLERNWIEMAYTGWEAEDIELSRKSAVPFTKDYSFIKMMALGTQAVPMLGLAAAVTYATKSPVAGASVIGLAEAAEEFAIIREKGKGIGQANLVFAVDTIMLSALETIPLTSFMKGGKLPLRMFRGAIQEGSEEVLQGLWRDSIAKLGYDETRKLTEGLIEEFLAGFISGGTIGAFSPGVPEIIKRAKAEGIDIDKMREAIAEQVINNADEITENFLEKVSKKPEPEVKPTIEIPEFKSTAEALAYGESIKEQPEIIEALKKELAEVETKSAELRAIPEEKRTDAQIQEGFNLGQRRTFLREALEGAGIKIEAAEIKPIKKPTIAKEEITKPEKIKPDLTGITPLQKQIQALKEREAIVAEAEFALEEIDKIRKYFKNRISRYKDVYLKEELTGIPKYYITTKEGGIKPDEVLEELRTQFNIDLRGETELKEYFRNLEEQRKSLLAEIEEAKPKLIVKRETTLLKERIKATEQGLREGKIQTKKEIKAVQTEIIKLLEASELEAKDIAKFRRTIKNVQTRADLSKRNKQTGKTVLEEIKERIRQLEESAQRRIIIENIKSETQKSKLKKLRPEFQKPILNLIESIDIDPRSEKKIKSLQATLEFLEENPDNQIPQKRLNELKRLNQKPIKDLTTEELQHLHNCINHFIKLNDLKNKIIVRKKIKEINEIVYQAVKNLNTRHEQLNGSLDGLDSMQEEKERSFWQKIFGVDSLGAEDKCMILDGQDKGVIFQVIYEGIDKGVNEQLKAEHTAEDFFKERFKGINIKNWSRAYQKKETDIEKVRIKISGDRTLTMTKAERVAFILHSRNMKNLKHLEKGGFAFEKTPSKMNKLSPEDIDIIVNSATAQEFSVADSIGEYLDTIQKEAINKVSVYLDGFEIAIEPDYWHARTNYLDRIKETIIKKGNYTQKTLEGLGIFKERQDASNALILEDAFIALYKSIKQSAAYIGLAAPLRSAKTLLNNNDFLIAAINAGQKHYIDSLKAYISRIEGESIRLENLDKLTTEWINKLDTAILGINPFVASKQRISWFLAGTEMPWKILRKHPPKKPTAEEITEMRKWHPQLRDRLDGNVTRELGEVAQVGRVRKFFTGEESSLRLQSIRDNDTMVITAIWNAVKEEISTTRPNLKGDAFFEATAERAWEVIRRTQPTFHIKDRSTIGMSRSLLWRLMTKYSSQRNKNWRIIRRAFEKYNWSAKTARDKADLMGKLFTVTVVNSLCIMLINMIRGMLFKKKDDEFKKKIFKQAIIDFFITPLSNIYFLGDFATALISQIDKGTFAGFQIENPLSSTINEIVNTLANGNRAIIQAITGEKYKSGEKKGEEKWRTSLAGFARGAFDITGRIIGVNLANIRKFFSIPFTFNKKKKRGRYR